MPAYVRIVLGLELSEFASGSLSTMNRRSLSAHWRALLLLQALDTFPVEQLSSWPALGKKGPSGITGDWWRSSRSQRTGSGVDRPLPRLPLVTDSCHEPQLTTPPPGLFSSTSWFIPQLSFQLLSRSLSTWRSELVGNTEPVLALGNQCCNRFVPYRTFPQLWQLCLNVTWNWTDQWTTYS